MHVSLAVGRRRSVAVLAAALLGAVMPLPGAASAVEPSAHFGHTLRQDSFPEGYFFVRNVYSGKVLDTKDGSTAPGSRVIVRDRRPSDNDNQLWKYDAGFLVNKKSGLVLQVPGHEGGGPIAPGTALDQDKRREPPSNINQLWASNHEQLMPYDPKVAAEVERVG
ncbi:RICIN domain-containing protein [Streptomyces sp. NPDC046931]|uniref:RICIN domain-containing protein n=1 Tax=Streptomyces sp. NPDC046931 TaxID=3154806 RepID=UPI003411C1A4